ncbi:hypothetical protein EPO33_01750 [Patescibacteria group bacterium]|nr:MAG: hypothetical protein EPO33_01750 [Patescibacteria group bacterium]
MKRLVAILLFCLTLAPASVQARDFSDLRTDLAAAPYRLATAVADFHPLAALSDSMRRGMASWDEVTLRAEDVLVIGWGRLALGAEEVRSSADRGLVAVFDRIFASPVPAAAIPAAIGTAAPPVPSRVEGQDPDAVRWVDEVERLFRSSP